MSFFKTLFGSGDTIDKSFDLVDKAFFTDEEKAEAKAKVLEAYAPFKLAQRYFMIIVTLPYMVAWFALFALLFIRAVHSGDITEVKDFLMNGDIIYLVMTMAVFYFGDTIASKFGKG